MNPIISKVTGLQWRACVMSDKVTVKYVAEELKLPPINISKEAAEVLGVKPAYSSEAIIKVGVGE